MLVAPVLGKDGDGAMRMQPRVVGGDVMGGVPQLYLPRQPRDGAWAAMGDEPGALIGGGRVGGVAYGQCQSQLLVEVSGGETRVCSS